MSFSVVQLVQRGYDASSASSVALLLDAASENAISREALTGSLAPSFELDEIAGSWVSENMSNRSVLQLIGHLRATGASSREAPPVSITKP